MIETQIPGEISASALKDSARAQHTSAIAAEADNYSLADSASAQSQRFCFRAERRYMTTLGAWGIANLATGLIAQHHLEGRQKAFWQMNAGWGAVNLALAIPGLASNLRRRPGAKSDAEESRRLAKLERLLLINAGLDVAYIATGLLMQQSGRHHPGQKGHRLQGWGTSIIVQGAFLLAYDLLFARNINKHKTGF